MNECRQALWTACSRIGWGWMVFIIPSCALRSAPAMARILLSRNAFRSSIALLTFRVGSEGAVLSWFLRFLVVICVTSVLYIRCEDDVLSHGGASVFCLVHLCGGNFFSSCCQTLLVFLPTSRLH